METTDTRNAAYHAIRPTLSNRQKQVLAYLRNHSGICNLEISDALHIPINAVTPRTFELRKMGLVERVGETIARTGHVVSAWRVAEGA